MEDLRYPIGRFELDKEGGISLRQECISEIELLPSVLRKSVEGLSEEQLDTPYRPDGWTVRQLIHHIADSHVNAYTRFRLCLTEQTPLIRTYDEKAWAELPDARTMGIEASLRLLDALHNRWSVLLRSLSDEQFLSMLKHPDWGEISFDVLLQIYSWHGRHHVAHISALRTRKSW